MWTPVNFLCLLSLICLCWVLYTVLSRWYYFRKPVRTDRICKVSDFEFSPGDIVLYRDRQDNMGAKFSWWLHIGIIVQKEEQDNKPYLAEFVDHHKYGGGLSLVDPKEKLPKLLLKGRGIAVRKLRGTLALKPDDMRKLLLHYQEKDFLKTFRREWLRGILLNWHIDTNRMSCSSFVGMILKHMGIYDGTLINALSPGQFSSSYSPKWDKYYMKEIYLTL